MCRLQRRLRGLRGIPRSLPQGAGDVAGEGTQAQHLALSQESLGWSPRGLHWRGYRHVQWPILHASREARVHGRSPGRASGSSALHTKAPSLLQLMHGQETGTGPVEVSAMDDEKVMEFDWDRELLVSERERQALEFMRIAMEMYGDAGQPLLPVAPR